MVGVHGGADDHFLVRLEASEYALHRRISEREPAGWSQLGRLLHRATRMHQAMAALDPDLVVDTERLDPGAAAAAISSACPRLRGGATEPA